MWTVEKFMKRKCKVSAWRFTDPIVTKTCKESVESEKKASTKTMPNGENSKQMFCVKEESEFERDPF